MLYYNPPVALVVLYDNDLIRRANDKAVAMGFLSGTTLANCIADFMEKFVDHVRHQLKHFYLAWNFSMGGNVERVLKRTAANYTSGLWRL